jgi:hypothetical protein
MGEDEDRDRCGGIHEERRDACPCRGSGGREDEMRRRGTKSDSMIRAEDANRCIHKNQGLIN